MNLYQTYKANRYRKYQTGGMAAIDPELGVEEPEEDNFSSTLGFGASLASGIIDATAEPDPISGRISTGATVGKGALTGAAMGSKLGPVGAGVGAVIGAGLGLLSSGKQKKAARAAIVQRDLAQRRADESRSSAMIATNPSLVEGYRNSSYFATGGMMNDPEGKKKTPPPAGTVYKTQGEVDAANSTARRIATGTGHMAGQSVRVASKPGDAIVRYYDPAGKDITGIPDGSTRPLARTLPSGMSINDVQSAQGVYWYNDPQTGDPVDVDPGYIYARTKPANPPALVSRADGGSIHIKPENRGKFTRWAKAHGMGVQEAASHVMANKDEYSGGVVKMANFAKNFGGKKENGGVIEAPLSRMYMNGGMARSLSSDGTELIGRSHENGGITVPDMGAELEDGETTKGNYVFSDKLGFAGVHKKLAAAKGKIEQKPVTRERLNSIRLLNNKENQLMLSQEYLRSRAQLN